jgi:hypothetical protein
MQHVVFMRYRLPGSQTPAALLLLIGGAIAGLALVTLRFTK